MPYCKYAQRAAAYVAARCQSRKLPSNTGAFFAGRRMAVFSMAMHSRAISEQLQNNFTLKQLCGCGSKRPPRKRKRSLSVRLRAGAGVLKALRMELLDATIL